MIELTIRVFGVTIEVFFPVPRTFSKELIDAHALWLTDSVYGLAVPPGQVRLRQGDVLFGYDLNVELFGGNGHFLLDAQKVSFSAKNARGRADGQLLQQVVGRFLRHFAKEEATMAFSANAYAQAESKAVQQEYVQRFRFDRRITKPGAVGYLRLEGWPSDIRVMVEPSLENEDSLFLTWTTRIRAGDLSANPDNVVQIFQDAAAVYGIQFRPLG